MASTPPTELPPMPGDGGTPDSIPTELPSPSPDTDFPNPTPGSDPDLAPGQPFDAGLAGDFA